MSFQAETGALRQGVRLSESPGQAGSQLQGPAWPGRYTGLPSEHVGTEPSEEGPVLRRFFLEVAGRCPTSSPSPCHRGTCWRVLGAVLPGRRGLCRRFRLVEGLVQRPLSLSACLLRGALGAASRGEASQAGGRSRVASAASLFRALPSCHLCHALGGSSLFSCPSPSLSGGPIGPLGGRPVRRRHSLVFMTSRSPAASGPHGTRFFTVTVRWA